MPLYEYVCASCQHKFEALVRSGEEVQCPACQGTELRKGFSVFAVNASSSASKAAPMPQTPCGNCAQAGSCQMNFD